MLTSTKLRIIPPSLQLIGVKLFLDKSEKNNHFLLRVHCSSTVSFYGKLYPKCFGLVSSTISRSWKGNSCGVQISSEQSECNSSSKIIHLSNQGKHQGFFCSSSVTVNTFLQTTGNIKLLWPQMAAVKFPSIFKNIHLYKTRDKTHFSLSALV